MRGTVSFSFWRGSRARRSISARCALLALSVLLVAALVVPLAYRSSGVPGVVAAALAALICFAGAAAALLLNDRLRGPDLAAPALLLGMLCRTGLPLVTALVIHLRAKELSEAGLPICLLIFYLLCLAVETWLSLPEEGRTSAANVN